MVWDQERYALHYGGTQGEGTAGQRPSGEETSKWGPNTKAFNVADHDGHQPGVYPQTYDPPTNGEYDDAIDVPEWEYNASVRYYYEKLHQWITEEYAPNVEALIQYNIPQAPTVGDANEDPPDDVWDGVWWDSDTRQEIAWVYKMQGGFDGHMYPGINLDWGATKSEVVIYMTHSIKHFRDNINAPANGNPYGYLTMWNGHTNGFAGHHIAGSLEDTIRTMYEARNTWQSPWSNFNAIIYHPIGNGGKQGQAGTNTNPFWIDYPIDSYVDMSTIILKGDQRYAFDPEDNNFGQFRVWDPTNNGSYKYTGLQIEFGSGRYPTWPTYDQQNDKTTVTFKNAPLGSGDWTTWKFRRPNKTITQWLKWWGGEGLLDQGSFLFILNDVLSGQ